MLDTLFKSLEDKGLQLSESTGINLPQIQPPKKAFYNAILSKKKNVNPQQKPKFIIRSIANQYFLVGRANTLVLYKYTIQANAKPVITCLDTQHLFDTVKSIHSCPNKYALDQPIIPIAVQHELTIQYLQIDIKTQKLIIKNDVKCPVKAKAINFISDRQILMLTQKHELNYFLISPLHKLERKAIIPACIDVSPKEILINATFLGTINQEQDSIIKLFFVTEDTDGLERLKVKEITRTIDNALIIIQENYLIGTVPGTQKKILSEMNIMQSGQFFLARSLHQIIVIKKKYNKYLFMDNVSQKTYGSSLILSKEGLICSLGKDTFELSFIKLADPKCYSRMLDSIQIKDSTLAERFQKAWTFHHQKETWIMMVFEKQGHLQAFCVDKLQPMAKLLQKVKVSSKDQLNVIQELAQNLGITKKDFYLKVWMHSKKQLNNIHDYLLPCEDMQSIKKQLKSWLRRKKMKVCQLLKVLEKVSLMIEIQLKTDLGYDLLKQYVKNEFLRKKVKLYGMNQDIDHRDFQKIYDSSIMDMFVQIIDADLFPKPQEIDPLHALAPKPKEQQKNVKHVLQEFRIALLQNYSDFVILFLKNYEKDILKVLQSYYFILPKHPYNLEVKIISQDEALALDGSFVMDNTNMSTSVLGASIIGLVSNQQPAWFSTIMPKSWDRQLTRDKLQKALHDHYSTSHILSVINSLSQSNYGKQTKLQRHGLVNYTHAEYKKKVQKMNGTKLYLRVCQFANQCAIKHNIDTATPKLVQLFKDKLKLDGVEYEECRLYCNMHYFMLKHNILEGKKITVQGLIELGKKPENLVAVFFLGNRQKKEYILNEFRSLYETPKQFNFVLEKFIFSENCSRIQLQILLKEVKILVPEFQSENQELIDLIIRGFCKKLELREQNSTEHFLTMIQQLHLKKTLALKVNQIVQLKESTKIFDHFNWSKKSYDEIIMDSRTTMIKLLESYFNQEMKSMDITIEYEYFSLEFPRNMLNVLLYLKENVFYDIDEKNVLMIYGEMLIQWKQFDVVKSLIHEQGIPEKLGFVGREYIEQLMLTSLDIIYNDQSIVYDQQTKNQIKNIIDIDIQEDSPFRVREQAKLAIVDIFEGWGCTVRPHDICLVTTQWKEMNRNQFIEDLITEYIENIDFNVLIQIYQLLEMTDKETKNIKTQNQEFAIFCLYYCECLRDMGRFKDVMEVMGFMKNIVQFNVHIPYELQSETFLQVVFINYGDDLNAGKKYIDYYYEKEGHDREMQKIFECYLAPQEIESFRSTNYIFVDKIHYFKRAQNIDISIPTELLWSIASQGEELNNQEIYYNYFYLLMMTKYPDLVISRMNKISYNHEKIISAVMRLEACIDEKPDLLGWNVYEIYKRMLKGFYLEAIHRIPNIKAELSEKEEQPEKSKLEIIKNLLKADREKNNDLLKVIGRCELHLENVRVTQRHIREKKYIDMQRKIEEQKKKIPEIVEHEEDEQPEQLNITIKFAELKQRKRQITSRSAFITERDIIDQVYDDLNQSRFGGNRNRNANNRGGSVVNNLFLSALTNNNNQNRQSEEVEKIIQLIKNQQYDKVRDFTQDSVIEAAKIVFQDQGTLIYDGSIKLQYLNLIDPNKLKMCRLFNIYKKQISDSDLKSIFTFDFLNKPLQAEDGQEYKSIFSELQQSLTAFIQTKRAEEAMNIAIFIGNVLEDKVYEKKTIALALEAVGNCAFSPDNLLKIREYISTLGEDMVFFAQCIPKIMKVFRKNPQLNSVLRENILGLKDLIPEIASLF